MPVVIQRSDVLSTIVLLRQIEHYAADGPTRVEAKRLADSWQRQIDPTGLIITG